MAKVMAPCQYCGSCSIWLAAFEEGTGLDTMEKVIEACRTHMKCPHVGEEMEIPDADDDKTTL